MTDRHDVSPPPIATPIVGNAPQELMGHAIWVLWRYERTRSRSSWAKIPYQVSKGARARSNDPSTWTTFEQAVAALAPGWGLGFMFHSADDIMGVDLDGAIDPDTGAPHSWARKIVETLDSYTEVSPSGTGIHLLVRARLGRLSGRRQGSIEMYESGRYFTFTGKRLDEAGVTVVESRQAEVETIHARHVAKTVLKLDAQRPASPTRADAGDTQESSPRYPDWWIPDDEFDALTESALEDDARVGSRLVVETVHDLDPSIREGSSAWLDDDELGVSPPTRELRDELGHGIGSEQANLVSSVAATLARCRAARSQLADAGSARKIAKAIKRLEQLSDELQDWDEAFSSPMGTIADNLQKVESAIEPILDAAERVEAVRVSLGPPDMGLVEAPSRIVRTGERWTVRRTGREDVTATSADAAIRACAGDDCIATNDLALWRRFVDGTTSSPTIILASYEEDSGSPVRAPAATTGPSPNLLQFRTQPNRFEDRSGRAVPAAENYTEGLLVAEVPKRGHLPVWSVSPGALGVIPADLSGNWSAHAAACSTTSELRTLLEGLAFERFEAVIETLPASLIHEWTGEVWQPTKQGAIHDLSRRRFEASLARSGASFKERLPDVASPLDYDRLDLVNARPETAPGREYELDVFGLPDRLRNALRDGAGIRGLFSHQGLALQFVRRMQQDEADLVLSTPTASGKTWAFLPGVVEHLMRSGGTAILLYPLKALGQDQEQKIRRLVEHHLDLRVSTFTGDDKSDDVVTADGGLPNLLIATPDKLNFHLTRPEIQQILARAEFIVLDEAHTYRSYFGSSMALFMRRLLYQVRRDCRIILSSATLENTIEFSRALTGRTRFRSIGSSGAPKHPRYFYLAQPSKGKSPNRHLPILRSVGYEVRNGGASALVFAQRRSDTLGIANAVDRRRAFSMPIYSGVKGYKAMVRDLARNDRKPKFIVSTSTLESGIDIGDLSTVAIVGFPQSRSSFKQMAGRAGRNGVAHVILLPAHGPADEFYGKSENYERLVANVEVDPIYINPGNSVLVERHLARFRTEANGTTGEDGPSLLRHLVPYETSGRVLHQLEERFAHVWATRPTNRSRDHIMLRGVSGTQYVVVRTAREGDPAIGTSRLDLGAGEEDRPAYIVEVVNERTAHREWALEATTLRASTYYAVRAWTRGRIEKGRYTEDAVFIWTEEITDQLMTAEEDNMLRVGAISEREPHRPLEHYHVSMLSVTTALTDPWETRTFDSLQIDTGFGTVTTSLIDERKLYQPRVQYLCRRWARQRGKQVGHLSRPDRWLVQDLESGDRLFVPVPGRTWDVDKKRGRLSREDESGHMHALTVREISHADDAVARLHVEQHRFSVAQEGTCSCGSPTEERRAWDESYQPTPASWHEHDVFDMLVSTFETNIASITLMGDSPGSLRAVANAITKALPEALKIDPQDVDHALAFEGESLRLHLYDSLEGGANLCTRVAGELEDVLVRAQELLEQSKKCTCEGKGCYGCITPFRPLFLDVPETTEYEAPAEAAKALGADPAPLPGERFLANFIESELQASEAWLATGHDASAMPAAEEALAAPSEAVPTDHLASAPPFFQHVAIDLDDFAAGGGDEVLEALLSRDEHLQLFFFASSKAELDAVGGRVPALVARSDESFIPWHGPSVLNHLRETSEQATGPLLTLTSSPSRLAHLRQVGDNHYLGLAAWTPAAAQSLNVGPDLIVPTLGAVLDAVVRPREFMHPLEQVGRKVSSRVPAITLRRGHLEVLTLGRRSTRGGDERLEHATSMAHAFCSIGQSATVIAQYLRDTFSTIPIVLLPPREPGRRNGMTALRVVLEREGHEVLDALAWGQPGPQARDRGRALESSSKVAPREILLVDDVLGPGSKLEEAQRVLVDAGFDVRTLALFYEVSDELEGAA